MIVVDGFEEGPVDKTDEGRGLIRLNREQPTTVSLKKKKICVQEKTCHFHLWFHF